MNWAAFVSATLFGIGLYGVLTRRDAVAVLASAEVMLGAAEVQLVAFARSGGGSPSTAEGLALLLLVVAAAEAAVGLALVVASVRRTGRQRLDELTEVEG